MGGGGWAFDHPGGVIADGDGAMAGCGFSRREAEDELSWGSGSLGKFWTR